MQSQTEVDNRMGFIFMWEGMEMVEAWNVGCLEVVGGEQARRKFMMVALDLSTRGSKVTKWTKKQIR